MSGVIFAIVLGVGSCDPVRPECADTIAYAAVEASLVRYKNLEIIASAEHSSDYTTGQDRGQELYLIKGKIKLFAWGGG